LLSLFVLVAALTVTAAVNNLAVVLVLAIAGRQSLTSVFSGFAPLLISSGIGWGANVLIGLLFTLAVVGHPLAALLFPAPLLLLYFSYRGYASARADHRRLGGLRDAARALSEPLYPLNAIHRYLDEVRDAFDSKAAVLILQQDDGTYLTYLSRTDQQLTIGARGSRLATAAERLLAIEARPVRVRAGDGGDLADALATEGWRSCSCTPLVEDDTQFGAIAVFDRAGFD